MKHLCHQWRNFKIVFAVLWFKCYIYLLDFNHWCCCDRISCAAYAQSFALWQQATIDITLLLLVHATDIYCCSSRTSRSWWVTHSTQRQPERLQQQSTCYVQSGAQPGILFGRGQSLNSSEFNLCYFGRRWFLCHSSISGLLQQDMTWNIFYHSASNSWNWYQAPAKKSEQVCSGGGHGLFCLILAVLLLRTPMVLTYHEFKTVCLSSVQKRTDNIHSFRLYMFSNNVDIKTNNRNYRKPFWILCVRD